MVLYSDIEKKLGKSLCPSFSLTFCRHEEVPELYYTKIERYVNLTFGKVKFPYLVIPRG